MSNPAGESREGVLRLDFDRRLTLQFRGSAVTSDAGLLAYRELDDALGLSAMAGETLADSRTGKNGRHALVGMLRQAVFGRLAGYEDVNDAERLRHDPAMRWIVGGKAASDCARHELALPSKSSALHCSTVPKEPIVSKGPFGAVENLPEGADAPPADAPQSQLQKELALLKEANARVYAKPLK
jgi:hypothetical protein